MIELILSTNFSFYPGNMRFLVNGNLIYGLLNNNNATLNG